MVPQKKFQCPKFNRVGKEQFENFAKTVWEPLETANVNSTNVGCFFVDTFLTFFPLIFVLNTFKDTLKVCIIQGLNIYHTL
ncbi:unnamed protein product [Tenebrio molitor]|nr:unnamed protein product [Tenebrio molitor]